MWNVSLTSSEQVATETRMTAREDRGNVLPLPNYRRIFFYFFFLPSFTVKSGSVTGCSIKIYRPGEKTREREREGGKRKKNAFHRPDLAFPFYSRFLLSRDRRRAGLSNHAKNNESQRRYSVSQWFTVDGFKSISSVKYKCFGYFQIFTKAWEEWWDPVMIDGKSKIVFIKSGRGIRKEGLILANDRATR